LYVSVAVDVQTKVDGVHDAEFLQVVYKEENFPNGSTGNNSLPVSHNSGFYLVSMEAR